MKTIALSVSLFTSLALAACGGATPPAASAASSQAPSAAPLDGTAYEVSLEFDGEAPVKDVLTFDRGQFESSACTALGFPKWTGYQATKAGDSVNFQVQTHNPKGPTVEWSGSVQGTAASGKAKRTIDGKTALGTFRGSAR